MKSLLGRGVALFRQGAIEAVAHEVEESKRLHLLEYLRDGAWGPHATKNISSGRNNSDCHCLTAETSSTRLHD